MSGFGFRIGNSEGTIPWGCSSTSQSSSPRKTGMRPSGKHSQGGMCSQGTKGGKEGALSTFFPFPASSKHKVQLFLPKTGMFCCRHLGMKLEFGAGTGSKLLWLSQFGVGFTKWTRGIQARKTPAGFGVDQAGNLAPGGTLRWAQHHPTGKMRMAEGSGELQNSQRLEWRCQSIRVTTMVRKSS